MKKGEYLLSAENVGKAFRKLAIPALLTTLISQIYNLTDAYFIGLLNDTSMLSAVSVAMPFMWLVSALCGMIGAGAPQLISLKDGAGDRIASGKCRSFTVFGTLIMSLVISPVAYALIVPTLRLMNTKGAVLEYAAEYLRVIIATSAISAAGGAMQGVLRAGGRTRHASIASMTGIIVNIALDPLFILGFDMGMSGAAWATALGSVASLTVSAVYVRDELSIRHILPCAADIGLIFKISLASTVSSVITALTVGVSFSAAASFGSNTMASISVCSRIYSTVISIVSALAFSIQPFIGYNYASGNHKRLMRGIFTSLGVGQAVCLIGTAVFACCGRLFMSCFTNDAALIEEGANMLRLMAIGLPVSALQMNAMSYLNGTGKAMRTLAVSLARQVAVFAPVMLLMQYFLGSFGLMLAYPVTDIIATVPAVALCVGEIKRMFSQNHENAKITTTAEQHA